ncbi:mucin-2 [Ctenodactylus gundi]
MGLPLACLVAICLAPALARGFELQRVGKSRSHSHNVCSTWGDFHYKTFDGDIFRFPGLCDYNFASDCRDSYKEFAVHLKRGQRQDGGHPRVESVLLTIKDDTIYLTHQLAVVNGDMVSTPHYSSGLLIVKNDAYTKVYSRAGLSLMWNREDALMLELDSRFQNHTCGLCGDYNGMKTYSEFLSEGECIHFNAIEFGNMQKINKPEVMCEDPEDGTAPDSCSEHRAECERLLMATAFEDCQARVPLELYVRACMQDLCQCPQGDNCVCSTVAEFSRQCSHAGGRPGNWRTASLCSKSCPGNMIYLESGSPCMDTCSHLEVSSLCEEHRMDGCFCPKDTVYDDITGSGCIPVSQCHCKLHGHLYAPGQEVTNNCEQCVCNAGRWVCKELSCPGTCALEGGSHITTFDGKKFTFHGDCYYVLTKVDHNDSYALLGELAPCGSTDKQTCLKTVVLLTDRKKNVVTFKSDGSVLLNELEVSLPHVAASFSIFRPSSYHIVVNTALGLQLQIQLVPVMQLFVTLDPSAQEQVQGLCGNFNGLESDDFKTSGGLVEATGASFANSWKAQSSCHDKLDWLDDPCSLNIESANYAEHWCSLLKKTETPFGRCHQAVDPTEYYKRCKYDTCNCQNNEDCLCAALSSYARACAAMGVMLWGWRERVCNKDVNSCPNSQIFLYNLTTCQQTCRSLSEGETHCLKGFAPVDGCGCPDHTYLDEKGRCVPLAKCSCYHHGLYLEAGDVILRQDERCTCQNGRLHCKPIQLLSQSCVSPKILVDCNNLTALATRKPRPISCQTLVAGYYHTGCVSGCICPDGLLDDGRGGCVEEEECPCVHNKGLYLPGDKIKLDCNNTCTCQKGRWECTQFTCHGTCSIYGSGHYVTFDGKHYDFDGHCSYVAVQDYCGQNSSTGSFSIVTENVPCGTTGVTCSKAIKIFIGRTELKLEDKHFEVIQLEEGHHVAYTTREVGQYLVVEASTGVIVIWDKKTTVFVKLAPSYKGTVCGLCGNFDDRTNNDFTTRDRIVVGSELDFGNSWKEASTCPDVSTTPDPCSLNPHRRSWAEKQCSIIKSSVFSVCHSKVDPTVFYEACVHDSCSCDSGGDCECFCSAVASYAQECTKAEACVFWRTPDLCPIFCDYYNPPDECEWHYEPCGNRSFETCRTINGIHSNISVSYLEGCYPRCPKDRPIYDEDLKKCVTGDQCGCYIEDTHYPPGASVPSKENCTSCVCTDSSHVICQPDEGKILNYTQDGAFCYWEICGPNGTIERYFNICVSTTPLPSTTTTSTTIPTSTTTIPPITTTTTTTTSTTDPCCFWTDWINEDHPNSGNDDGDHETFEGVCVAPEDIQCRSTAEPHLSLEELGQKVQCNVSFGFICKNEDQFENGPFGLCYDYEIRVNCCVPVDICPFTTNYYSPSTHSHTSSSNNDYTYDPTNNHFSYTCSSNNYPYNFTNDHYGPSTHNYTSSSNNDYTYDPTNNHYRPSTHNHTCSSNNDYTYDPTNNQFRPPTHNYTCSSNNYHYDFNNNNYRPSTHNYTCSSNNYPYNTANNHFRPSTHNYTYPTDNHYWPSTLNHTCSSNNYPYNFTNNQYGPSTHNYTSSSNNDYTYDPTNNHYRPSTHNYTCSSNNDYTYDPTNNHYGPSTLNHTCSSNNYPYNFTNNQYGPSTHNYTSSSNNDYTYDPTNNHFRPSTHNHTCSSNNDYTYDPSNNHFRPPTHNYTYSSNNYHYDFNNNHYRPSTHNHTCSSNNNYTYDPSNNHFRPPTHNYTCSSNSYHYDFNNNHYRPSTHNYTCSSNNYHYDFNNNHYRPSTHNHTCSSNNNYTYDPSNNHFRPPTHNYTCSSNSYHYDFNNNHYRPSTHNYTCSSNNYTYNTSNNHFRPPTHNYTCSSNNDYTYDPTNNHYRPSTLNHTCSSNNDYTYDFTNNHYGSSTHNYTCSSNNDYTYDFTKYYIYQDTSPINPTDHHPVHNRLQMDGMAGFRKDLETNNYYSPDHGHHTCNNNHRDLRSHCHIDHDHNHRDTNGHHLCDSYHNTHLYNNTETNSNFHHHRGSNNSNHRDHNSHNYCNLNRNIHHNFLRDTHSNPYHYCDSDHSTHHHYHRDHRHRGNISNPHHYSDSNHNTHHHCNRDTNLNPHYHWDPNYNTYYHYQRDLNSHHLCDSYHNTHLYNNPETNSNIYHHRESNRTNHRDHNSHHYCKLNCNIHHDYPRDTHSNSHHYCDPDHSTHHHYHRDHRHTGNIFNPHHYCDSDNNTHHHCNRDNNSNPHYHWDPNYNTYYHCHRDVNSHNLCDSDHNTHLYNSTDVNSNSYHHRDLNSNAYYHRDSDYISHHHHHRDANPNYHYHCDPNDNTHYYYTHHHYHRDHRHTGNIFNPHHYCDSDNNTHHHCNRDNNSNPHYHWDPNYNTYYHCHRDVNSHNLCDSDHNTHLYNSTDVNSNFYHHRDLNSNAYYHRDSDYITHHHHHRDANPNCHYHCDPNDNTHYYYTHHHYHRDHRHTGNIFNPHHYCDSDNNTHHHCNRDNNSNPHYHWDPNYNTYYHCHRDVNSHNLCDSDHNTHLYNSTDVNSNFYHHRDLNSNAYYHRDSDYITHHHHHRDANPNCHYHCDPNNNTHYYYTHHHYHRDHRHTGNIFNPHHYCDSDNNTHHHCNRDNNSNPHYHWDPNYNTYYHCHRDVNSHNLCDSDHNTHLYNSTDVNSNFYHHRDLNSNAYYHRDSDYISHHHHHRDANPNCHYHCDPNDNTHYYYTHHHYHRDHRHTGNIFNPHHYCDSDNNTHHHCNRDNNSNPHYHWDPNYNTYYHCHRDTSTPISTTTETSTPTPTTTETLITSPTTTTTETPIPTATTIVTPTTTPTTTSTETPTPTTSVTLTTTPTSTTTQRPTPISTTTETPTAPTIETTTPTTTVSSTVTSTTTPPETPTPTPTTTVTRTTAPTTTTTETTGTQETSSTLTTTVIPTTTPTTTATETTTPTPTTTGTLTTTPTTTATETSTPTTSVTLTTTPTSTTAQTSTPIPTTTETSTPTPTTTETLITSPTTTTTETPIPTATTIVTPTTTPTTTSTETPTPTTSVTLTTTPTSTITQRPTPISTITETPTAPTIETTTPTTTVSSTVTSTTTTPETPTPTPTTTVTRTTAPTTTTTETTGTQETSSTLTTTVIPTTTPTTTATETTTPTPTTTGTLTTTPTTTATETSTPTTSVTLTTTPTSTTAQTSTPISTTTETSTPTPTTTETLITSPTTTTTETPIPTATTIVTPTTTPTTTKTNSNIYYHRDSNRTNHRDHNSHHYCKLNCNIHHDSPRDTHSNSHHYCDPDHNNFCHYCRDLNPHYCDSDHNTHHQCNRDTNPKPHSLRDPNHNIYHHYLRDLNCHNFCDSYNTHLYDSTDTDYNPYHHRDSNSNTRYHRDFNHNSHYQHRDTSCNNYHYSSPNHHCDQNDSPYHHNYRDSDINFCEVVYSGTHGDICWFVNCSVDCELQFFNWSCPSTPSPTTTPSTPVPSTSATSKPPGCSNFDPPRQENETWWLCNCTMAICKHDNIVEIVEIECIPPPMPTCTNGLKPVRVVDPDGCCWHWECDCYCTGWGDPHYVTFDGLYYSYQGNCTYVLVEEITSTVDNFGVYIDNYHCDVNDKVSCPRTLIVRHETQEVLIKTVQMMPMEVQVLVNKQAVALPYRKYGLQVYESGINFVVNIPELGALISYNGLSFSIKLPYSRFGNNTKGQCGTCTNSTVDDCVLPSGEVTSDCELAADQWVVNDPSKPHCPHIGFTTKRPAITPGDKVPKNCTRSSVCELILNNSFAQCHSIVPPQHYYDACVFDSCFVPGFGLECASVQTYAALCAQQGICVDWREQTQGACPVKCPSHREYQACGPAEEPTCQSSSLQSSTLQVEGCFCPKGTINFAPGFDACVKTCGCVGPDNVPREFGEHFTFDCKDCICLEGGSGIVCQPKECNREVPLTCKEDGTYLVTEVNPANTCCNISSCKCNTSLCKKEPPRCPLGFEMKSKIVPGKCCPLYSCEPKNVCVHGNAEYQPGSPVYSSKCQDCVCTAAVNHSTHLNIISCTHVPCNISCDPGFEPTEVPGECCKKCEQTHCIINRPGGEYTVLKPGEIQSNPSNKCTFFSCMKIHNQLISSVSNITCPDFDPRDCVPGSITFMPNGCCKKCLSLNETRIPCSTIPVIREISHAGCAKNVTMNYCSGSCGTFAMYSAQAQALDHRCSCCKEERTSQREVVLNCPNGGSLSHTYTHIESCLCQDTVCELPPLQRGRARRSSPRLLGRE